tara:strand:+ start:10141 stop:10440 length:300 start_codon:yes stop_codon:yes gene_type:complete
MASKGRPTGSTSRYCLIKDKALLPYEIHVDESTNTYLKVVAETQSTAGYYASLPHLIRSISRERYVPQGENGKIYTLKEYLSAMEKMTEEMNALLYPST